MLVPTFDSNSVAMSSLLCLEKLGRRDHELIIFDLPNISSEDRINTISLVAAGRISGDYRDRLYVQDP